MMDQVVGWMEHDLDLIQSVKPSSIIHLSSIYFWFPSTFLHGVERIPIR